MSVLLSGLSGFAFCFFLTRIWISVSGKLSAYQAIREEGPREHLERKRNIPTMGGIAILLSVSAATIPYWNRTFWILLGTLLASGLLGLTDDVLKVVYKQNLGLKARHKLAAQVIIGAGLWWGLSATGVDGRIAVPFLGTVDCGSLYLPLVVLVYVASTNAVNLTDGLDGLAAGVVGIIALFFLSASLFLSSSTEQSHFSAAIAGSLLGFLWFNGYPAAVFMGDVGSLALGGALCALALSTGLVLWLPVAGGMLVLETLSVMLQVAYFKLSGGRRILKMSPLHHHFELCGVAETQVTLRFWIATALLSWASFVGVVHGAR